MIAPTLCIALLSSLIASTSAAVAPGAFDPSSAVSFLDYQPAFITPTAGAVWIAGKSYSASWNATLPSGVNATDVGQTATFYLGFKSSNASILGENLDWTLASDVPLYAPNANNVTFTLPADLPYRSTYLIALIGSSRDVSAQFTILGSQRNGTRGSKRSEKMRLD